MFLHKLTERILKTIEVKTLDKYEYRVKTEKMISHMERKSYEKAMEIADTIDWRRVRNVSMLYSVSRIYEQCEQFNKSRNILFLAYDRAQDSKKIIYQLGQLAIKMGDVNEAMDCYDELLVVAPKDPNQYILRYEILKAEGASLPQQIEALSKYKKIGYVEKWAYELAQLYYAAEMYTECATECNDLILWFGEGEYIEYAQMLKAKSEKAVRGEDYTTYREVPKYSPVSPEPISDLVELEPIVDTVEVESALKVEEKQEESLGQTIEISEGELETIRMAAEEKSEDTNGKTVMIDTLTVAQALEENKEVSIVENTIPKNTAYNREITGQMRIDEILAGWEEKQREMEAAIAAEKERVAKEEIVVSEEPEIVDEIEESSIMAEESVVPPVLDDEIRQLMEDIENGVEPENTYIENKGSYIEDIVLEDEEVYEDEEIYEDAVYEDDALEEPFDDAAFEETSDNEAFEEPFDDTVFEESFEDTEFEETFEEKAFEETFEDEPFEESFEEETFEDEAFEEETFEDEAFEETFEDDVYEDDVLEDEAYENQVDEVYEDDAKYETDEEFEAEALEYDAPLEAFPDESIEEEIQLEFNEEIEAEEDRDVEDEEFTVDFDMEEPMQMDEDEFDLSLEERAAPSRIEVAKAVATGKTAKIPVSEIAKAIAAGGTIGTDTGFIVQAKYDLEAQSEVGLRAGLSEEQKKLFSYFVPVRGMSEQLVDVLERDKYCSSRGGTSKTGNLLIIGRKGSGKTVLAVDVVKAIQKNRDIAQGKVAIVTGEAMNKKKISDVMSKLYGGALIIEKANQMNERTVTRLNKAMERDTGELLIVLEDERRPLDTLLSSNIEFRRKFTSRLEVPIFINDELVTFGQTYARENECKIDEMGILALYSRIDSIQREDHPVTVAEVKDILDGAIDKAKKHGVKRLAKKMFHKPEDEGRRFVLTEKHFKN